MSNNISTILLVGNNPAESEQIKSLLEEHKDYSFELEIVPDLPAFFDKLNKSVYDLVLLDLSLPNASNGLITVKRVITDNFSLPVIVLADLPSKLKLRFSQNSIMGT